MINLSVFITWKSCIGFPNVVSEEIFPSCKNFLVRFTITRFYITIQNYSSILQNKYMRCNTLRLVNNSKYILLSPKSTVTVLSKILSLVMCSIAIIKENRKKYFVFKERHKN